MKLTSTAFWFLFFSVINHQVFAQYILEKEIKFDNKIGSKSYIPTVESMFPKGNNLYFMGDNTVTITDNKGTLIKKITPIRNISLGYTGAIGKVPFDTDNNYYVLDGIDIKKYNSNRELVNSYSIAPYFDIYERNYGVTIEVDAQKNLYFGGQNYFVTVIDIDGKLLRKIGKRGNLNGQFDDSIRSITIDDDGNIYVKSGFYDNTSKIQVFNKDGVFLRKIAVGKVILDFSIDKKGNVYLIKSGDNNIFVYDQSAKLTSTISLESKEQFPQFIAYTTDNQIVIEVFNSTTKKRSFIFQDLSGAKKDFAFNSYNLEAPTRILDLQIHPISKNLVVLDQFKTTTYDKDFKIISTTTDLDKGVVSKIRPSLFNFDSKGKMYFFNDRGIGDFDYEIFSEDSGETPLFKLKTDWFVKKLMIEKDSLNNDVILIVTPYSVKSYNFKGTLLKTYISSTGGYITQFTKGIDGNYVLLDTWNDKLEYYDKNFKLLQKKTTTAFLVEDFAMTSDGGYHTVDEYFNKLRIESYDNNGKFISSATAGVNYPSGATIKVINDKLVVAGLYMNYFSVFSFSNKSQLKSNYVRGDETIPLFTVDKTKDLKNTYSSASKNLNYKIISGESVKVSTDGVLEVIKGGEAIMEVNSPENNEFNGASMKVLVVVKKTDQTLSGIANIEKATNDTDFNIVVKSDVDAKPSVFLLSGESINFDASTGNVKIIKEGISAIKVVSPETDKRNGYVGTIFVTVTKPKKITTSITVNNISKKIDDIDFSLVPTSNSNSKFNFQLSSGDAVSVASDGKVKVLKAGQSTITVSQFENDTHTFGAGTLVITVSKLDQILTVDNLPAFVYQNSVSFDVKSSANSLLPVDIKILSGPAKLENNKVVLNGQIGNIELEFSQKGNDKYNPSPVIKKTVEVKLVLSSLQELNEIGINIYPNPASDKLFVSVDSKFSSLTLFDIFGKLIFEKDVVTPSNEFDIGFLQSGIYILTLIQKDKSFSFKLIKQ